MNILREEVSIIVCQLGVQASCGNLALDLHVFHLCSIFQEHIYCVNGEMNICICLEGLRKTSNLMIFIAAIGTSSLYILNT
jgi:hypothetical protein